MRWTPSTATRFRGFFAGAAVLAAATLVVGHAAGQTAAFAAENDAAMKRMMAAMEIKRSGSVDRDFVAMMIPHHQGAIDMAVAELRYGSNEYLRRIAQEIVVGQQQEIAAMRMAIGLPLPPSAPAPTQAARISHVLPTLPSTDICRARR